MLSGRLEGKCLQRAFSEEEKELHDAITIFLSLLVLGTGSPYHWACSCHTFRVLHTPLSPRNQIWDLWSKLGLSSSTAVWVPLLSLQKDPKERGKTERDANREGDSCSTPSFSCMGSLPALQALGWCQLSRSPVPILLHPPAASVQSHAAVLGGTHPLGKTVETGVSPRLFN